VCERVKRREREGGAFHKCVCALVRCCGGFCRARCPSSARAIHKACPLAHLSLSLSVSPCMQTRKFQKADVKAIADEYEARLRALHSVGVENVSTVAKAAVAVKKAAAAAAGATGAPRGGKGKRGKAVAFVDEADVFDVVS
jgi:hypothetical protein